MRKLLFAIAAVIFFFSGVVIILNQPETIRYILKVASVKSPWKIEFQDFQWKPLQNRMVVSGLHLKHSEEAKELWVKDVNLKYRPWDFIRGKIVVSSLEITDIKLSIPKSETPKKKIQFNITRLFILQNLIIKDGIIRGMDVSLPKEMALKSDELRFELSPTLFSGTKLTLRFDGVVFSQHGKPIADAASLTVGTSTRISKWTQEFPYINALEGSLDIEGSHVQGLEVDKMNASLKFLDHKLDLDPLTVAIKGKSLSGSLKANIADQSFECGVDIPKPVSLPYIGKELVTVDTGGELSGSLKISGKGFIPSESSGKGEASFVHRFSKSPEMPIAVTANAEWKKGVITISDGRVAAQDDTASFDGSIDISKKKILLNASGTAFPIELVFDKFKNPHLRKIFGKTDFTASFDGWLKQFQIKVKGTTHNGGYQPITAETVDTEMSATYDQMSFKWKIIQGGKQTGTADLDIKFGKMAKDGFRAKDINLDAHLENHPLAASLSEIGLSGLGSGDLVIKGPHLNIVGTAHALITDGKWLAVSFDKAKATLDITKKKIAFNDIQLAIQKLKPIIFSQPLTMDLADGGLRLWGTPDPSLNIDIGYQYEPKKWQIKKISYADFATASDIQVAGTFAKGGAINLSANGRVDLEVLTPLGFLVREAKGPASIKMAADGVSSNPSLKGKIEFENCLISPRFVHLPLDHVKGDVIFEGHTITFDNLTAMVEDGNAQLKGNITHSRLGIASADLALTGKDLRYRTEDGVFRMEFDGDLTLKGQFPQPLLAGDITILDARYTKDFNLLESITGSKVGSKKNQDKEITFSPRLDLRVHNTGDLFIRNNVGNIGLRADLTIKGTRKSPQFGGTVNVTEGKIHYMGMEFDITRGFVEFRQSQENPYIEVEAQREIKIYNITIAIHGNIDNLAMDLSATSPTGPLEKRDVISLLAFGMTEIERQQMAAQKGGQFGAAMAAQQLTHVVEQPVTGFSHLDTFRLEAADPSQQSISRVTVGKQFSDRLNVNFATDINTQDATQTVTGEYLFTDNLLLKGSRSSNGRYEIDGAIRFRLR